MMTKEWHGSLFYVVLTVGLVIASILFTGPIESPVEEMLPAPTTPAFAKVKSIPEAGEKACLITTEKMAFYRVETSLVVNNSLVISGVVYASDFVTPVPEVLIEIWQANIPSPPHYLLHAWAQTDGAGHYQATILKPSPGNILALYFRIRYQNRCPLALQLFFVDDPALVNETSASFPLRKTVSHAPVPTTSLMPEGGLLLQGPLDIVLSGPVISLKAR